MKIEIWSDVACPWCYIGKKRFENALEKFPHADKIEVEYKSFLLNPNQQTNPDETLTDYLAREKGLEAEQVAQMMEQVRATGETEGIDFLFNEVVVANTVRAHALLQLAKAKGKGADLKQRLLHAYFSKSVNVDDPEQLLKIAEETGLDRKETREALTTDTPFRKVEFELKEAQALGIQGVPFFVIDRKYAISGAQEADVFLQALERSFSEWEHKQKEGLDIIEGDSCTTDGDC